MATYLDMQTRIMDELDRPDLLPQVKKAILSAVSFYAHKKFYFTETSYTFNTIVGQEYYGTTANAAIVTSPNTEILNINVNQGRVELDKVSFEDIDSISYLATSMGQPDRFAWRANQFRLYPIPSQVWTITAFNTSHLTTLSADSDTNVWMQEDYAEALIRARAKMDLILNVIRGVDMSEELAGIMGQETQERAALFSEAASRKATGVMAPTDF